MSLPNPQLTHESGDVIGEKLSGIGTIRCVTFASPSEVERDAGKVLGVLCHLEGVTGVIGGQVGNENERLAGSLLVIVHGEVVCLDLRHWGSLLSNVCQPPARGSSLASAVHAQA